MKVVVWAHLVEYTGGVNVDWRATHANNAIAAGGLEETAVHDVSDSEGR